MKNIIPVILIALCLSACTRTTKFGDCVGIADDKDKTLKYELSWWNTAVAFIFSETIVVPVVTLATDIQCPVAKKGTPDAILDK